MFNLTYEHALPGIMCSLDQQLCNHPGVIWLHVFSFFFLLFFFLAVNQVKWKRSSSWASYGSKVRWISVQY